MPLKSRSKRLLFYWLLILVVLTFLGSCARTPAPTQPTIREGFGQGWFQLPGYTEPSFLTYEIQNDHAIWQGDIILGKVDAIGSLESQSVAKKGFNFRWPSATIGFVPFVGDPNIDDATEVNIQNAINHWQANTPIRFVARTTGDRIRFVKGDADNACASFVGRQGGEQKIFLTSAGTCSFGALVHEIGHAVGLYHEHSRTDRNSFVTIVKDNIDNGDPLNPFDDLSYNFDIPGDAQNIGSYDFRSIMHYGCFDFGKKVGTTTLQVILPINPPAGMSCTGTGTNRIGQRDGLSAGDIAAVNALYPPSSLAWSQNTTGIGDVSELNDHMGKVLATGDFNNDGRDDLAVGIPDESVGNVGGAGIVQVFYGSATGMFNIATDQVWHQNSSGIIGAAETDDHFGAALAAGDFNNDGFDDLAIGIPDENTPSTVSDSGAVAVLYGTTTGLSATNSQFWSQNASRIADTSEGGDRFGAALAAGDFNNNGFDDLAIGVPNEDFENPFPFPADFDSGSVHVIYGSSSRLSSSGSQRFTQDSTDIQDETELGDQFGFALAAGDFSGNGIDDLAIGIPFEDVGTAVLDNDSGAVAVIYGTTTGLGTGDDFMSQDSHAVTVTEGTEGADNYGFALAAGDFNNDARMDLAIGSPGEDLGLSENAGVVSVLYGASAGVATGAFQAWSQNSSGIEDTVEGGDKFGFSLAAGRLNSDAFADLVIGVPREDTGILESNAGAVNVIFGSSSRLTASGDRLITQNTVGLNNANSETIAESGDEFGAALAIGNFNGSGNHELAIGVPGETIGSVTFGAGMVNIMIF